MSGEVIRTLFYLSTFLLQGAVLKSIIEYNKDSIEFSIRYVISSIMYSMTVTLCVGWVALTLLPIRDSHPVVYFISYILIDILGIIIIAIIYNSLIRKNQKASKMFDKVVLSKEILNKEIHISNSYKSIEFHLLDGNTISCVFDSRVLDDIKNNKTFIEAMKEDSNESIIIVKESVEYMSLIK